mmetsp:Transcript_22051/g.61771  ORF Transcript_22051/g.61771 Transcript_22051/m.61771 type:complete len:186 (-) Transcript_22051:345-902(-)
MATGKAWQHQGLTTAPALAIAEAHKLREGLKESELPRLPSVELRGPDFEGCGLRQSEWRRLLTHYSAACLFSWHEQQAPTSYSSVDKEAIADDKHDDGGTEILQSPVFRCGWVDKLNEAIEHVLIGRSSTKQFKLLAARGYERGPTHCLLKRPAECRERRPLESMLFKVLRELLLAALPAHSIKI